jgi:hypothetical protein
MTSLHEQNQRFTAMLDEIAKHVNDDDQIERLHFEDVGLSQQRWSYLNQLTGMTFPYPASIGHFFAWPCITVVRLRGNTNIQKFTTKHGQWFLKNGELAEKRHEVEKGKEARMDDPDIQNLLALMKAVSKSDNTDWPAHLFGHMDQRISATCNEWLNQKRANFNTRYPSELIRWHYVAEKYKISLE